MENIISINTKHLIFHIYMEFFIHKQLNKKFTKLIHSGPATGHRKNVIFEFPFEDQ